MSIADTWERLLADACPPSTVRNVERGAPPTALWSRLHESGFLDTLVAEAAGGSGLALSDAFALFVAEGRHLLPVPAAHTMIVRAVLAREKQRVPPGRITIAQRTTRLADGSLSCPETPYGAVADWVVVQPPGGWMLLRASMAERTDSGIHGSLRAHLRWPTLPPRSTLLPAAGWRWAGAAVAAAQIAGAMQRTLEMTLKHANDRVQFGRPIGKFQAIQHQIAVMAENTAATLVAAEMGCTGAGPLPTGLRVAAAKSRASEAATLATSIAHAVHGAIGVTAEYDLQLYTRRLHEWRADFGAELHWNRVLGRALLAPGAGSTLDFMRGAIIPSNDEINR